MQNILNKLFCGKYIDYNQSKKLFHAIIQGKLSSILLTAIIISMKVRGECFDEIFGAADALLSYSKYFPKPDCLFADIVGTGGDNSKSINISTASAIIAAGCGIKIVKHGNYGISNNYLGSSNLLTRLGINVNISAINSRQLLDSFNICFLLASKYHSIFYHMQKIRKQLKTSTIFNILGPIVNPARPPIMLIGTYNVNLLYIIAKVVKMLGCQRAAIVHGGGMDEVVLHSTTNVVELYNNNINKYTLTPMDFGLKFQSVEKLISNSPRENHNILINLLKGKGDISNKLVIAVNVALLLKLCGYKDLRENTHRALNEIESGNAYKRIMLYASQGK